MLLHARFILHFVACHVCSHVLVVCLLYSSLCWLVLSMFLVFSWPALGLFWVPLALWGLPCMAMVWVPWLALSFGLSCMLCLLCLVGLTPFHAWFQSLQCLSHVHICPLLSALESFPLMPRCWAIYMWCLLCFFMLPIHNFGHWFWAWLRSVHL